MRLCEVLNSKYPVRVIKSSRYAFEATVLIASNLMVKFGAEHEEGEGRNSQWGIYFVTGDPHDHFSTSTDIRSVEGREFKVFSVVKQMLEMFIKKYDPNIIRFSSLEPERTKLYKAFVKKYALHDYHLKMYDDREEYGGEGDVFVLVKREPHRAAA